MHFIRKRLGAAALCAALLLTLLPAGISAEETVPYLDESGQVQTQADVTEVTSGDTAWSDGWYVIHDDVWIYDRITVTGEVSLILADACNLHIRGGIRVGDGSSLTIYGQEAGTGGVFAESENSDIAAIGGNAGEDGGTIAIHGGRVTADNRGMGFDESAGAAAGIGGGAGGDGGTITITGGTIGTTGGRNYEQGAQGAGIGGGSNGGSGRITITGGMISAYGDGIGCGSSGTGGTVSITGGYFSQGDLMQNTVCGAAVAEGLFVSLQMVEGQAWYWVTDRVGELFVSGGTAGTDYTRENGVLTILSGTPLTISGSGWTAKERIVVGSGVSASLTLEDVDLFTESAPLEIPAGSMLELTLAGENQFSASRGAGVLNQGELTIRGDGALKAQGSYSKAGIETAAGTLTINGGTITAAGGNGGAGIGGSSGQSGGTITINNGQIVATTGTSSRAAGIGGGEGSITSGGSGGNITINGGTVTAVGGYWGAGIGGGGALGDSYGTTSGSGGKITITGGIVTATGDLGAGIGGSCGTYQGRGGNSGDIQITGGVVTAASNRGAGIGGGGGTAAGSAGKGDTITISGGVVAASSAVGAGIGGGGDGHQQGGAGGAIVISGGTVTAKSDGEGLGIGGGPNADSGTFSTGEKGSGVILATAIGDQSEKDNWSGMFFEGDTDGTIYGTAVTPTDDFTIPEDTNLVIGPDQEVVIPAGITVTILGTAAGDMTLESGAGIQIGNGPKVQVGAGGGTVVSGPAVALPGGGSAAMTDGQGGVITVTMPESGGTIAPDDAGRLTLPAGSTIQTANGPAITVSGENAAVTPDGAVQVPGGGSVIVTSGQGSTTTVTLPAEGGVIVPEAEGNLRLPGGSAVQTNGGQTVTMPESGGILQPDGELRYMVTVRFDSQGGSSVASKEVTVGTLIDQPEEPTRDGYTFTGWYQDAECTKAWDFAAMPAAEDLTLYAGWKAISSGGGGSGWGTIPSGTQLPQTNPFEDVARTDYYYDAVLWAVEQEITEGLTETAFGPDRVCTRAQVVTFLWRAAGSPKADGAANPFTDVSPDAYYYDAVLWAAEKGITGGTAAGTFSPNSAVTRGQTVTFLYRAAGSPAVSGSSFADVAADAYYTDAVAWAAQEDITSGTTAETFSPDQVCTRAQIVTFLYRDRA